MARNHAETRRRSILFRWSVYALTALVLCAVPVSVWLEPGVVIERVPPPNAGGNRTLTMAFMTDGVLMVHRYPKYPQSRFNTNPPGWKVDWSLHAEPWPPIRTGWNRLPVRSKGVGPTGPDWRVEIPTVPAAFILTLLGVVLWWWARRSRPPGCCNACGYSLAGLKSDICPECGAEISDA